MLPMTTVQSHTEPAHPSLLAGRVTLSPLHRPFPRSSGSLSPVVGDDRPRFLGLG